MRVLNVRNVQEALPCALQLLNQIGVQRESRNGPVLFGGSVSTVYEKPIERVLFHAQRNGNPFFHLYESLWMIQGRNDVAPLERYVKNSVKYSDDGKILHGAYGYRWRSHFPQYDPIHRETTGHDQLWSIAQQLRDNPDDRRCVLQMWDVTKDLGRQGKDFPCNTIATFQRGVDGELNLMVFCRSNDIIWGAYGANAVQFGALLEYMALWIGCAVGTYTQVSVNWHGYIETLKTIGNVLPDHVGFIDNPYIDGRVHVVPMAGDGDIHRINELIEDLLGDADTGFVSGSDGPDPDTDRWGHMVYTVLRAHHIFKTNEGRPRYNMAINFLEMGDQKADWIVAAREWFERARDKWVANQPENF